MVPAAGPYWVRPHSTSPELSNDAVSTLQDEIGLKHFTFCCAHPLHLYWY